MKIFDFNKLAEDFKISRKGDIITIVPLKKDGSVTELLALAIILCLSKDEKCKSKT